MERSSALWEKMILFWKKTAVRRPSATSRMTRTCLSLWDLLVDTSLSQRRVLEEERHASYSFLDQMLHQAKDVAFVIHFDHEVELLQDLTANREKLDSRFRPCRCRRIRASNKPEARAEMAAVQMAGVQMEEAQMAAAIQAAVAVDAMEAEALAAVALFSMTQRTLPQMS